MKIMYDKSNCVFCHLLAFLANNYETKDSTTHKVQFLLSYKRMHKGPLKLPLNKLKQVSLCNCFSLTQSLLKKALGGSAGHKK